MDYGHCRLFFTYSGGQSFIETSTIFIGFCSYKHLFLFDFDLSDILMVMFHKLKFGNWIASILLRYSDGIYLEIYLHLGKAIVI